MRTVFSNALCAVAAFGVTAGLVGFSDPAVAAAPDAGYRQATVQTRDLDLRSAAGRATADRRIHAAAGRVCETGAAGLASDAGCRGRAIAAAERTLDAQAADTVIASR